MFNEIVVPLDGSNESARALRPASTIAHYLDITMRVVAYHPLSRDGQDLTDIVCEQVNTIGEVSRVITVEPMEQPVDEALINLLADRTGALVVMSSHGYGRSAALVGSVANELLAQTGAPVLMIGPECDISRFRLHGPMIVAADGADEYSEAVLALAADAVKHFDFEPSVVNVLSRAVSRSLERARTAQDGREVPPDSAIAHHLATDLGAATGLSDVDYRVLHDSDPGNALVKRAIETGSTMIVMATHARSGIDRLAHGSVTSKVVGHAPCPVLAVAPGSRPHLPMAAHPRIRGALSHCRGRTSSGWRWRQGCGVPRYWSPRSHHRANPW